MKYLKRYWKFFVVLVSLSICVVLARYHNELLREKDLVKMATLPIPPNLNLTEAAPSSGLLGSFERVEVEVSLNEFLRDASGTTYYVVFNHLPTFMGPGSSGSWVRLINIQNGKAIYSDWDSKDEIVSTSVSAGSLQTYRYEFQNRKYLFWSGLASFLCGFMAFVIICTGVPDGYGGISSYA